MQLYDTLTRTITDIQPNPSGVVGLYACGLTVYDYTHLGHLRKYTMDDILFRTLGHFGYKVSFVRNVTDVGHLSSDGDTGEDKLEKGAKKYNKSVWEIAREFEDYFVKSMDLMGNLRPDVSCRATEHIVEQLHMVIALEQKGFAYVIPEDGVYFDTSKLDDYGKLARLNLEGQQEGARLEVVRGKRNPSDFALWKFETPGENRAMIWPSPWHERSFPGWHIECSAMAMKYLGDQFAIHTGGIDHIPVHHTNEIAQAEAVTGKKPFVRHWVHHNFLRINGEKMSKSLGNFYTIDDMQEKGFHPLSLRLLFLTAHYRSEMNFTWENLAGAQKSYLKLLKFFVSLLADSTKDAANKSQNLSLVESTEKIASYTAEFFESLRVDLNTPQAVSVLWNVVKDKNLAPIDKKVALLAFSEVLGLGLENAEIVLSQIQDQYEKSRELPQEITELLSQRSEAREQKNYQLSDEIREKLSQKGYVVEDFPDGKQVAYKK